MSPSKNSQIKRKYKNINWDTVTLSDDVVMRVALDNNPEAAKAILAPILGRKDFAVKNVKTQYHAELLRKHSVIFDCVIEFSDGTICDLEMQKGRSEMDVDRILYYEAMLRASTLRKGEKHIKLRPTILVIIYKGDFLKDGYPLYVIRRTVEQTGKRFDHLQTIYIADLTNTSHSTDLGKLMSDLTRTKPEEIHDSSLSATLGVVKSSQGGRNLMNDQLLDIYEEGRQLALEEGREKGRKEERAELLLDLVRSGDLPLDVAAKRLGVSEEEFKRLLSKAKKKA